jgi:hypothetical protein
MGHILPTNCLLKHVIKGNIEEKGGREIRSKQLLKNVKETRTFWKLRKAEPDSPIRRTRFASGNGLFVKTEYMMGMIMMTMMVIIMIFVPADFYSLSTYLSIFNLNN